MRAAILLATPWRLCPSLMIQLYVGRMADSVRLRTFNRLSLDFVLREFAAQCFASALFGRLSGLPREKIVMGVPCSILSSMPILINEANIIWSRIWRPVWCDSLYRVVAPQGLCALLSIIRRNHFFCLIRRSPAVSQR
jgi:hypothetical protein